MTKVVDRVEWTTRQTFMKILVVVVVGGVLVGTIQMDGKSLQRIFKSNLLELPIVYLWWP